MNKYYLLSNKDNTLYIPEGKENNISVAINEELIPQLGGIDKNVENAITISVRYLTDDEVKDLGEFDGF